MQKIKDFDIREKNSAAGIVEQFRCAGFQASELAKAAELIAEMKREKAAVFFGFTANLVASGLRGVIAEMCRKKMVDAIVTTAGSIDHDVIKTLVPYGLGSFSADDIKLHRSGINRVGNIFVPNKGFILFEKKMQQWLGEFCRKKTCFSPSGLGALIGSRIKSKDSFLYWCAKNKIPVFCPGITDGAVGLQMYFFKQENREFCVDVTADMDALAQIVLTADKTGAIILGGGISKHHIIGANLMRGGLDYAVYISTAGEFDGSLSGARTSEAKSWGKIKEKGKAVHVCADATIAFPLVAAALKEKKVF